MFWLNAQLAIFDIEVGIIIKNGLGDCRLKLNHKSRQSSPSIESHTNYVPKKVNYHDPCLSIFVSWMLWKGDTFRWHQLIVRSMYFGQLEYFVCSIAKKSIKSFANTSLIKNTDHRYEMGQSSYNGAFELQQ